MPLRPATFTPYPAQDRRAAARERYYRALEEARRAKEAYAEAVAQDEADEEKTKPLVAPATPTPAVAPTVEPAPSSPAPVPTPVPTPAPAPTSNAFAEWVRANMGVPSVFAPSDSAQSEPAATTPAAPTSPLPMREERERRRAALRVTELASSPEPNEPSPVNVRASTTTTPTPSPTSLPASEPMLLVVAGGVPERTPLQRLADAAEAAPPQSPRRPQTAATPVHVNAPAPNSNASHTPTPAPAPAPVAAAALLGPKPKSPSPTPQHIPLFAIPAAPADASSDPLREITTLAQTLAGLKAAFVFPERLDFGLAPSDQPGLDVTVCRLPVCPRNLAVHAYEHALGKILARLEGVGNVRARVVREKRKDAVRDVKEEMERVRREVERRAREAWGR